MDKKTPWDDISSFYNKMALMEIDYTYCQIDCLEITDSDTVIDMGCGPGRISSIVAERAMAVTSVDSSKKMLEYCRTNVANRKLSNVTTVLLDWYDVVPGDNLKKHDIVIASRTPAMNDIEKLSSLANKYVAIVIWANAPSIPEIIGTLFKGTIPDEELYPPKSVHPQMMHDRSNGYNTIFNNVYDLGYEPNIKILTDGFIKEFINRDEAYDFLLSLKPELSNDKKIIAKRNFDNYLTNMENGNVEFKFETRSCVIWWKPEKTILE